MFGLENTHIDGDRWQSLSRGKLSLSCDSFKLGSRSCETTFKPRSRQDCLLSHRYTKHEQAPNAYNMFDWIA